MLRQDWEQIIWKTWITVAGFKKGWNQKRNRKKVLVIITEPAATWYTSAFVGLTSRWFSRVVEVFVNITLVSESILYEYLSFHSHLWNMKYVLCDLGPTRSSWISRELCQSTTCLRILFYVASVIDLSSDWLIRRPNLKGLWVRPFIYNYAGKEENLNFDTAIIAFG